MKLIIGKNSRIVREITHLLEDCHIISHREIASVDLNKFKRIYLFSWSHNSETQNLKILELLELSRVTFISTIAVCSCERRKQWAKYPNMKLKFEKKVIDGGGKVIRIGIWNQNLLAGLPGVVPVTTPEHLVQTMNESENSFENILWPVQLHAGSLRGYKKLLSASINAVSQKLPPSLIFQAPLSSIIKFFLSNDYGYTHDCLYFSNRRAVVGYGAVGSKISDELRRSNIDHSIVVSKNPDLLLNNNGFRGLRIGQYREGLSKLWHGVSIKNQEAQFPTKSVPLFVHRPSVPSAAIIAKVKGVKFDKSLHSLVIESSRVPDMRIFAEKIHLAAGAINNVKILQSAHPIHAFFSDHEVSELGCVSTDEVVKIGLIRRRFGLVWGRKVIKGKTLQVDYLLDFRPKGPATIAFDAKNIYSNRTGQVVAKLIGSLSLSLINQALFNKFGASFDAGRFSIVAQVEAKNTIELTTDGELTRSRLPSNVYKQILTKIQEKFHSFEPVNSWSTFDGIHVHGGFDLDQHPVIARLIRNKELFLHGNVFDGSALGPFHNTVPMIKREIASLSDA